MNRWISCHLSCCNKLLLLCATTRGRQRPAQHPTGLDFTPFHHAAWLWMTGPHSIQKKQASLLSLQPLRREWFLKKCISFGRSFCLLFLFYHLSFELDLVHFLPFFCPPLFKKRRKKRVLWFNSLNRHSAGDPEKYSDFTEATSLEAFVRRSEVKWIMQMRCLGPAVCRSH